MRLFHWFTLPLLFTLSCGEQVVVRDVPSECGNGTIEGNEACDDGNEDPGDACTDGCKLARCGDGLLRGGEDPQAEGYEACDDGNTIEHDMCRNDCSAARCGDGIRRQDLASELVSKL